MFDLPGLNGVEEVVVNDEAVVSGTPPLMIYADNNQAPANAS